MLPRAMRRFPEEFADLLSPQGLRLLAGRHADAGRLAEPRCRLLALPGMLDAKRTRAALGLLEKHLLAHMRPMEKPIPPEATFGMKENYAEALPKVMRQASLDLDGRRTAGLEAAKGIGLVAMLHSESYLAFAHALAGRALKRNHGLQALLYRPGDYAGPHNDHHPEEPAAREGYLDIHIGFATPAVKSQLLVYARSGHLSESVEAAQNGLITAYRLPFWHYTTPLTAKRGLEAKARRWLLLGTFLYAEPFFSGKPKKT